MQWTCSVSSRLEKCRNHLPSQQWQWSTPWTWGISSNLALWGKKCWVSSPIGLVKWNKKFHLKLHKQVHLSFHIFLRISETREWHQEQGLHWKIMIHDTFWTMIYMIFLLCLLFLSPKPTLTKYCRKKKVFHYKNCFRKEKTLLFMFRP